MLSEVVAKEVSGFSAKHRLSIFHSRFRGLIIQTQVNWIMAFGGNHLGNLIESSNGKFEQWNKQGIINFRFAIYLSSWSRRCPSRARLGRPSQATQTFLRFSPSCSFFPADFSANVHTVSFHSSVWTTATWKEMNKKLVMDRVWGWTRTHGRGLRPWDPWQRCKQSL